MTTVAVRGGVMAADSQLDYGGQKVTVDKIRRLSDGSLIASAGDGVQCEKLELWVERGCKGRRPRSNAEVLLLKPDGKAYICAESLPLTEVREPFFAIGAGAAYAFGAMDRGATAREAVETAIKYDARSGAPVSEFHLNNSRHES